MKYDVREITTCNTKQYGKSNNTSLEKNLERTLFHILIVFTTLMENKTNAKYMYIRGFFIARMKFLF